MLKCFCFAGGAYNKFQVYSRQGGLRDSLKLGGYFYIDKEEKILKFK